MEEVRNTKRIAKNTVILYFRMGITMIIALYSSRIILNALGVEDFGLYNVVAGVVAVLTFLRTSLTTSTQRFLSFALGTGDDDRLKKLFNTCLYTHILIGIIIFILAETIGLWFLNTYIQIPENKVIAANWIYQFSIVSLLLGTITVPYNADIISHEETTYYAIVTITEAVLKLVSAFILFLIDDDRLVFYGALMMIVQLLVFFMYWKYCHSKYKETVFMLYYDKSMFSNIFKFSSWTVIGELSVVAANQGINILVNIYYTLTVNAAMTIAQQVNNALSGLIGNFQTAYQPQLTKSYAIKDFAYLNDLVCKTSKISFFLLFIVSVPIIIHIDYILQLWLGTVPEYTNIFCVLYIIASLVNAISTPLWISVYASGDIKWYQIISSLVFFSNILFVFLLFHFFDVPPTVSIMVKIITNSLILVTRLIYAQKKVPSFSTFSFVKDVIARSLIVAFVIYGLCIYLILNESSVPILYTVIILLFACIITLYIGFTKGERKALYTSGEKIIKKLLLSWHLNKA